MLYGRHCQVCACVYLWLILEFWLFWVCVLFSVWEYYGTALADGVYVWSVCDVVVWWSGVWTVWMMPPWASGKPSQVGGCVTIPPVLVSSSFMCLYSGDLTQVPVWSIYYPREVSGLCVWCQTPVGDYIRGQDCVDDWRPPSLCAHSFGLYHSPHYFHWCGRRHSWCCAYYAVLLSVVCYCLLYALFNVIKLLMHVHP